MPLNNPGNQAIAPPPFFDPQQIRELVAYVIALPIITKTFVFGPTIPTVAAPLSDHHAPARAA